MTTPRRDVYRHVTDSIIAELEQGVRPWVKPWRHATDHRIALPRRCNGVVYRGINILLLWSAGLAAGYTSPTWMTFKQARALGACVRGGERGSLVVYSDFFKAERINGKGESVEHAIPFLKAYTVFNVQQIDGLGDEYDNPTAAAAATAPRIAAAETFFRATGAVIRHGGNAAWYAPIPDAIQLPHSEQFIDAESGGGASGALSTPKHLSN